MLLHIALQKQNWLQFFYLRILKRDKSGIDVNSSFLLKSRVSRNPITGYIII